MVSPRSGIIRAFILFYLTGLLKTSQQSLRFKPRSRSRVACTTKT